MGCGGGLPRIAYSRNWACDSAIFVPTLRRFPALARSSSKAARIWRVGTQAEREVVVVVDCPALRIRELPKFLSLFNVALDAITVVVHSTAHVLSIGTSLLDCFLKVFQRLFVVQLDSTAIVKATAEVVLCFRMSLRGGFLVQPLVSGSF